MNVTPVRPLLVIRLIVRAWSARAASRAGSPRVARRAPSRRPDGLPARCAGETNIIRVHSRMAAFNRESAGRPSGTGSLRLSLTTTRPSFSRHRPPPRRTPTPRRGERGTDITTSSSVSRVPNEAPCPALCVEVWRSVGWFPACKEGRGPWRATSPGGAVHRQRSSGCSARPFLLRSAHATTNATATSAARRPNQDQSCHEGYVAADSEAPAGIETRSVEFSHFQPPCSDWAKGKTKKGKASSPSCGGTGPPPVACPGARQMGRGGGASPRAPTLAGLYNAYAVYEAEETSSVGVLVLPSGLEVRPPLRLASCHLSQAGCPPRPPHAGRPGPPRAAPPRPGLRRRPGRAAHGRGPRPGPPGGGGAPGGDGPKLSSPFSDSPLRRAGPAPRLGPPGPPRPGGMQSADGPGRPLCAPGRRPGRRARAREGAREVRVPPLASSSSSPAPRHLQTPRCPGGRTGAPTRASPGSRHVTHSTCRRRRRPPASLRSDVVAVDDAARRTRRRRTTSSSSTAEVEGRGGARGTTTTAAVPGPPPPPPGALRSRASPPGRAAGRAGRPAARERSTRTGPTATGWSRTRW